MKWMVLFQINWTEYKISGSGDGMITWTSNWNDGQKCIFQISAHVVCEKHLVYHTLVPWFKVCAFSSMTIVTTVVFALHLCCINLSLKIREIVSLQRSVEERTSPGHFITMFKCGISSQITVNCVLLWRSDGGNMPPLLQRYFPNLLSLNGI